MENFREVLGRDSEIDHLLQNAADPAGLVFFQSVDLPPEAIPEPAGVEEVAPAQPAAILAPAAGDADGDPVSPRFPMTTQDARHLGIVLANPMRATDSTPAEDEDYGYSSNEEVEDEDHGEGNWSSNLLDDVHPQELAAAQAQVERPQELVHEADPLNQAALVLEQADLEKNEPAGLEAGAVGSTTAPDMSPTVSSTTRQQDQSGAVDVSLAASSTIALELPKDDVPAEAAHLDVWDSSSDTMVEADDASIIKLRKEVARTPGSGPHIANPALDSTMQVRAGRSEDAPDSEEKRTLLVSSLDPIQDQEGSITSTALQKEEQESLRLCPASSSSI